MLDLTLPNFCSIKLHVFKSSISDKFVLISKTELIYFGLDGSGHDTERKLLDEKTTKEALEQIEISSELNNKTTVVFRPDWHKGVIGIVASRLIERHYKPTIVLTKSGEVYSGSVRSVKGFDVYEALLACSAHMIQFGGHKYAAGLTLDPMKYSDFKKAFEKEVSRRILPEQLEPTINYDLEVTLDKITQPIFRIINQMSPFGPLNRQPLLYIKNCLDNGGTTCEGDPGIREGMGMKLYLAYLRDPSGNKLCALKHL